MTIKSTDEQADDMATALILLNNPSTLLSQDKGDDLTPEFIDHADDLVTARSMLQDLVNEIESVLDLGAETRHVALRTRVNEIKLFIKDGV